MDHVGKTIRRLREERGLNQAQLAVSVGTGPSAISQIENGKRNPNSETLVRLARALEVEVADLFPKAQAPLSFEDLADEEDRQVELSQARRARDFLQEYPHEEARAELLEKIVGIHAHYNKLSRDLIAAAKEQDVDVNGTSTMMSFFFGKGLQDSLEENGVIAYVNAALQGKVEVSPEERGSCRRFSTTIGAEIAKASRLVEDVRNLARQQHSAAHEAELGIPDIEAYLANVSSRK
jgi:transcriptional regulator with XRE-family HTH domain